MVGCHYLLVCVTKKKKNVYIGGSPNNGIKWVRILTLAHHILCMDVSIKGSPYGRGLVVPGLSTRSEILQ